MLLGYDDNTCEWCSLDDTGRIDSRQSLSEHGTESDQHTQHIQFMGRNRVLVITQDKSGNGFIYTRMRSKQFWFRAFL